MTNHLKHLLTKATTLLLITVSMVVSVTSGLNIFNLKVQAAQSSSATPDLANFKVTGQPTKNNLGTLSVPNNQGIDIQTTDFNKPMEDASDLIDKDGKIKSLGENQNIDCGLTVIPIGTILKFGGRAFKVEKLVETGGKKLYKVVETVVDLCKVAFIEPTFVDRLLGTVRASAAGCKIVGKAIQSIASLRKLNIYKGNAVEHVLEGNINNAGAAGGFHHIDSSVGIVDSILNTKTINGLEIYEAKVTINGVRKLGKSTMFPDKWSRQQVIDAIEEANVNKQFVKNEINTYNDIQNNVYRGTTNSGLTIEMYIEQNVNSQDFGKIISAFPVLN